MASPAKFQDDDGLEDNISLFRAAKKRKYNQRQRIRVSASPEPSSEAQIHDDAPLTSHGHTDVPAGESQPAKSVIGRKAPPRRRMTSGIEFSASTTNGTLARNQQGADMKLEATPAEDVPLSLSSRFATSTGMMSRRENEERYLMAYIDSHLQDKPETAQIPSSEQSENPIVPTPGSLISQAKASEPATAGRLQEIDLGPRARRKNEKATLKASQQLAQTSVSQPASKADVDLGSESDSSGTTRRKKKLPPKVRVNRHGKILPPRRSRTAQRSNEDAQRDRAVEEMLRSGTSLALAGDTGVNPSANVIAGSTMVGGAAGAASGIGEADEELVERFRREYFENSLANGSASGAGSVANRSSRNATAIATTGPKRGGSRSARLQATSGPARGGSRGGGR